MQIAIGCLDGKTYFSDYISDEDMQKELEDCGGHFGYGEWDDMVFTDIHEFSDLIADAAMNKTINGMKVTEFNMVISGENVKFNPQHIVWVKVSDDKE